MPVGNEQLVVTLSTLGADPLSSQSLYNGVGSITAGCSGSFAAALGEDLQTSSPHNAGGVQLHQTWAGREGQAYCCQRDGAQNIATRRQERGPEDSGGLCFT